MCLSIHTLVHAFSHDIPETTETRGYWGHSVLEEGARKKVGTLRERGTGEISLWKVQQCCSGLCSQVMSM